MSQKHTKYIIAPSNILIPFDWRPTDKPKQFVIKMFTLLVDYATSLHMYVLQFFSFRAIPKIIGYFMWM